VRRPFLSKKNNNKKTYTAFTPPSFEEFNVLKLLSQKTFISSAVKNYRFDKIKNIKPRQRKVQLGRKGGGG
jgi:hypothetical protein